MRLLYLFIAMVCASFLAACGGGGGGGPAPAVATATVSFRTAFNALNASSFQKTFTISGTCGGTAILSQTLPTSGVTFEGVPGRISHLQTTNLTFTGCVPNAALSSSTNYFDANYTPLGSLASSSAYGVFAATPSIPATVTTGDSGTFGTILVYTNSTKAVSAGQSVLTYTVEADTTSSVIFNLKTTVIGTTGVVTAIEEDRYRVTASGTATLVSVNAQTFGPSPVNLILQ